MVDPSHPVTLTVDTNVISTTSHQPCDQDGGYSEAKQPAYDLFLGHRSEQYATETK